MADRNRAGNRVGLLAGSIAANQESIVRSAGVGRGDSELRGRVLGLASMAASFLPARRAASVNPTDSLRAE